MVERVILQLTGENATHQFFFVARPSDVATPQSLFQTSASQRTRLQGFDEKGNVDSAVWTSLLDEEVISLQLSLHCVFVAAFWGE